jgi:hypothetical protein
MLRKISFKLVLTAVIFLSVYSFVSILHQSNCENTEVVEQYNNLEQQSDLKTELTLVRIILNGVEQVFKVF